MTAPNDAVALNGTLSFGELGSGGTGNLCTNRARETMTTKQAWREVTER